MKGISPPFGEWVFPLLREEPPFVGKGGDGGSPTEKRQIIHQFRKVFCEIEHPYIPEMYWSAMIHRTLFKKDLIDMLEDIEWEDFEVKEARDEIPKSSWETVSSFSNTSGGWLIFGVRKKGKKFEIIGTTDPERISQDFTSPLRNGSKFNKVINVISKKFDFDGKIVLAFYIPRKRARDKPIYFNSLKNTFIRTASGDQRATSDEIDSFFRASSLENPDYEKTEYTVDDLDPKTIERYRTYFTQINPGHRFITLNDNAFLHKLGALADNMVTFAGLLVFGSEDAIARELPHYRIEYLEIPGISYEEGPTRYSYRISSEENLFSTFFDINERLMNKNRDPVQRYRRHQRRGPPTGSGHQGSIGQYADTFRLFFSNESQGTGILGPDRIHQPGIASKEHNGYTEGGPFPTQEPYDHQDVSLCQTCREHRKRLPQDDRRLDPSLQEEAFDIWGSRSLQDHFSIEADR